MHLFKFSLSLCVCILISFLSVDSLLAKNGVVVNQTMGHDGVSRDYYHLRHRLEIDNFTLITPSEWLQCHYCIVWKEPIDPKGCYHNRCYWDGSGNFIIYIKKDVFPIPSGCNSDWLKLEMKPNRSGRVYETSEAALALALESKRQLWLQIVELHEGRLEQLDVVLELNPYFSVLSETPLLLKLDHCNLYFRTADNAYIDHLNAVRVDESQP